MLGVHQGAHVGIFGRLSRLVRAEVSHTLGRERSADLGTGFTPPRNRPDPRNTEPKAPPIPDDVREAYAALGVSAGGGRDEARPAYLRLLKRFHPDRHQDDGPIEARANEITLGIQGAWERLERWWDEGV